MNKILLFALLISSVSFGQSFAPAAGVDGSTAIAHDSSCFVGWASGGTIIRGFVNINDTTITYDDDNHASFGVIEDAYGEAGGNGTDIVSLGDSGIATMTFDLLIQNGPGFDFAIFENGFMDDYMELAHVEVSSDGVHFFRFLSTSETPLDPQLGNASVSDCRMINNLAGKYRVGYGTPFDIDELADDVNLDKMAIRYVRLIDVVGDVDGPHTTTDQNGFPINDPFPTNFHSGGFDLDGIGIINGTVGLEEYEEVVYVSPNPTKDITHVLFPGKAQIEVVDLSGNLVMTTEHLEKSALNLSELEAGVYLVRVIGEKGIVVKNVIKE